MLPGIKTDRYPAIYRWTNKVNGKNYVGSTVDCYKRYSEYKNGFNNTKSKDYDRTICRAMRKYGFDNFDFTVLEIITDVTQLESIETRYINDIGSSVDRHGYNVLLHGRSRLGVPHTDETKIKCRTNSLRFSKQVKERFSKAVYQIDMVSKVIVRLFSSAREAARQITGSDNSCVPISKCCRMVTCSAFGYIWRYKDIYDLVGFIDRTDIRKVSLTKYANPKIIPIHQFTIDGILIRNWPDLTSISAEYGYDISALSRCCKGESVTSYGFIWKHITNKDTLQWFSSERNRIRQEEKSQYMAIQP